MDKETLLEAYRANVRKLIYPSLRNLQKKDETKIQALLHRVLRNEYHDEFPVISVLNTNCLAAKTMKNYLEFNLLDETLVNDILNCSDTITMESLKQIIIQEINYILKHYIERVENDADFKELLEKRDHNNGAAAMFWDTVCYDFIDLNRTLQEGGEPEALKKVFLMLEELEKIRIPNRQNQQDNLKFNTTYRMFERGRRYREHYLIKLLSELEYNPNMAPKLNGDVILKFLTNNGLSNRLLNAYKIHPTRLSSTLHLKLLQNNLIQDDFEYQSVIQQNDSKLNSKQLHLGSAKEKINHLVQAKMLLIGRSVTDPAILIEKEYGTREHARNALKEFVNKSGIDDLNKFLVDLWLIEIHKIYNQGKIKELRDKFINEDVINIGDQEYRYTLFENGNHFLESTVVKNLRKDSLAKEFIKEITEHKERSKVLNRFLLKNKTSFASYGSNMYFTEKGSVQTTATNLYKKLKLYKNLGSFRCHRIVVDAFKNHMLAVHIRYTYRARSYDGIGHFGGFANEIKRLKIKENNIFVSKSSEDTVEHLNKILKEADLAIELNYDGTNITFNNKDKFLKYLDDFNDILHQNNKIFLITNEDTIKKRTAKIAANKKFNNLCNENEKDLLKEIIGRKSSLLTEVYSTENNGTIAKSGTNGLFNAERFRYDISTVFSLEMSREDFKLLQNRHNNNMELKEVTTVEVLSLFELLQRFGYYAEAGNIISMISEQDDYKCYAYKYPHEYFAGVIKTITNIVNNVIDFYTHEFHVDEIETKRIQLWILGHLVAAAQNEILDGKHAKLVKQNSEINGNVRRYFFSKKPAKHVINFKKYIHESIGRNIFDDLDEDQTKLMQEFFSTSITAEDFNKIQMIASRVHLSVTIKNLENSFLDSGKLCLAEFSDNEHPLFNINSLTVYKSLEYETESEAGLSLSYLVKNFGDTFPIKRIIEKVVSEAPFIFSGTTYVPASYFKNRLNELVTAVNVCKVSGIGNFKININCKPKLKSILTEQFQSNNIKALATDNGVTIEHTTINISENHFKDALNAYIDIYNASRSEGEVDIKKNFISGFLALLFDSITDEVKVEGDPTRLADFERMESIASGSMLSRQPSLFLNVPYMGTQH